MTSSKATRPPPAGKDSGIAALLAFQSALLRGLGHVHGQTVYRRRLHRLAAAIVPMIPAGSRILDLGSGDGRLAALVAERCPDCSIEGLEVAPRSRCRIHVSAFDGWKIPMPDEAVDIVMLADVLHHTADPMVLLREAARVARRSLIIKDHRTSRIGAAGTLRFMDWVGNRPHHVPLTYNYWPEPRWRAAWDELGLAVEHFQTELGLYPWPARCLFETGLHFLAKLSKPGASAGVWVPNGIPSSASRRLSDGPITPAKKSVRLSESVPKGGHRIRRSGFPA